MRTALISAAYIVNCACTWKKVSSPMTVAKLP